MIAAQYPVQYPACVWCEYPASTAPRRPQRMLQPVRSSSTWKRGSGCVLGFTRAMYMNVRSEAIREPSARVIDDVQSGGEGVPVVRSISIQLNVVHPNPVVTEPEKRRSPKATTSIVPLNPIME